MKITRDAYLKLLHAFPAVPPEAGGILGRAEGSAAVTHFVFDAGLPQYDRAVYTPDTAFLNAQIAALAAQGIRFCGIVHSHPPGQTTLSGADLLYARRVLAAMPPSVETLYFPIVLPFEAIIPFSISRKNGAMIKETLEVISTQGGET